MPFFILHLFLQKKECKISRLFLLTCTTSIVISNACASTSLSQTITPLDGPTSNQIMLPGYPSPTEFKVDTVTSCPVPTFNLVSGYGRVNDKNDPIIFPPTTDVSRRSANGFSVAAGITIPLTGNGDACQKLLEAKVDNVQQFNAKNELVFQSEILKECFKLYKLNINFEHSAFDKDGSSSALFPCRNLVRSFTSEYQRKATTVDTDLEGYNSEVKVDESLLIKNSGSDLIIIEDNRK